MAHLARVVGTDGDAKLSLDEGVVDQVSHIFKGLPVVFTDAETKLQLDHQNIVVANTAPFPFSVPSTIRHFSPPVEVRLTEAHHEQRHLKCCQHQQHLGEETGSLTQSFVQHLGLGFFSIHNHALLYI